jgi:Ca2+-binding EF-hand superfamily protein
MKTIPVSLLLTGILLPSVSLAQPIDKPSPPPIQKQGQRQGRTFDEIWKATDKDGDGSITAEELATLPRMQNVPLEKREKIFLRLDNDTDGKLSREELQKLIQQGGGFPMKRLWELDADRNSSITFEEFKNGPVSQRLPVEKQQEMFERLDTNRDGVITKNDRPNGQRPLAPQSAHLGFPALKLDSNKDGALSFEEFRQGPRMKVLGEDQQEASFQALDANGDLKITVQDFAAANPPAN